MWCFISQPNSVIFEVHVDPKAIGQDCLEKVVGLVFLAVEIAALIINSRLSIFIFKTCAAYYRLIIAGIVVGGFVILVAVVGCCWVIKKSTKLLIHYDLGIFVAALAISSITFYAFLEMRFSRQFSDELSDLYQTYNRSAKSEKFWNNLQSNAWCCGIEGPEDWRDDIPTSCCTSNSADYTKYSDKCQNKISNRPYTYADGCETILKRYIANLSNYTFYPSLGVTLFTYDLSQFVVLLASSGLCLCAFIWMLLPSKLSDELSDLYHTYNRSAKSETFWNNLLSNAWCCGIEGPEDWRDDIPISCCTSRLHEAFGQMRKQNFQPTVYVCEHLNIVKESDYFGLKYEGSKGEELWLNLRNPIQVTGHSHTSPLRFALRVKFWVPPHLLLQESTRHQFYLHARLDLMEKRLLPLNWECLAKLIALIAQAEVGDYSPLHPPSSIYVQASNLVPSEDTVSAQDLLQRVIAEHKSMTGMKASAAEYWLLKEVSTLESFGEEMFHMKPGNIKLGVGPHGITKYEVDKEKQIIPFTAIQSAASHRRLFKLEYVSHDNVLTHLETKLESNHAASSLYRAITEKHAFYSCETVRSAVTEQFIRDLKGTIVSIFNEDSSLGKKYVFDIRRTCREVYDNARRALYVENQMLGQVQEPAKVGCEGKQCKDSHERLTRLLDAMTCKICMDNQIETAFFPCAHVVACSTCASKCERCPLCRADIKQSQKVYLPAEFGESVY